MRIFVNEPGYDDVGALLTSLGQGFEWAPVDGPLTAGLVTANPRESIVFLNCGAAVPLSPRALHGFIEGGGAIYASDRQAPLMESIFPDIFVASAAQADTGIVPAEVVDQGLAAILGSSVNLVFDAGGWQYLEAVDRSPPDSRVRVYVKDAKMGRPLVVRYVSAQGGSAFFTAFHNVRQDSRQGANLLRFLVFTPLLTGTAAAGSAQLRERSLTLSEEFTAGLRPSVRDYSFTVPADSAGVARLDWVGQGRLALTVVASDGRVVGNKEGWVGPLEVPLSTPGVGARVLVTCHEFVQPEIPFVVQLACTVTGRGTGLMSRESQASTPRPTGPLTLTGADGRSVLISEDTVLNRATVSMYGDESRFWDPRIQCRLLRRPNGWSVVPNPSARNMTLVNGEAIFAERALQENDTLSVGNPVKGQHKLPLTIAVLRDKQPRT